jgi:hypothetical protein
MIAEVRLRLVRRILTLIQNTLHPRSVRHSWEIEIDAHFDDSRRRDCENGFEESRIVGYDVGCESDDGENGIGPSANH